MKHLSPQLSAFKQPEGSDSKQPEGIDAVTAQAIINLHPHLRMPIRILLLLFGLSYLLSVSAIPATRTHNLNTKHLSALAFSTQVETLKLENGEMQEQFDMDEGFIGIIRRMAFETQDYGGGAEAIRIITRKSQHNDALINSRIYVLVLCLFVCFCQL
ncbi:uncharacterized protein LOC114731429 [Neltuma alba]|uniref:uncharacterized protein LOC114731429 n=1 Tax=Neltuma alba TaxID=207710 RepID=UPI0010A348CA|nr:uncharacterized protein LOC114731429 [Prosopis alba]